MCKIENLGRHRSADTLSRQDSLYIGGEWITPLDGGKKDIDRASKVRVGLPLNEAPHMGPRACSEHLAKTLSYIDLSRHDGDELTSFVQLRGRNS